MLLRESPSEVCGIFYRDKNKKPYSKHSCPENKALTYLLYMNTHGTLSFFDYSIAHAFKGKGNGCYKQDYYLNDKCIKHLKMYSFYLDMRKTAIQIFSKLSSILPLY